VLYAGIGALVLFLGVNFWALSAIGLFGGDSGDTQAVPVVDDSSATPSQTPVTPPRTTQPTSVPPPVQKTTVPPTKTTQPTQRPTKTRTSERPTEDRTDPKPSRTSTKTVKPPRPSTTTPTREEILRQYCIQRGWDPKWCDPDNWPQDPGNQP